MATRPATPVPAYVTPRRPTWLAALAAPFAVLHDIHWRAPWDERSENVCKVV